MLSVFSSCSFYIAMLLGKARSKNKASAAEVFNTVPKVGFKRHNKKSKEQSNTSLLRAALDAVAIKIPPLISKSPTSLLGPSASSLNVCPTKTQTPAGGADSQKQRQANFLGNSAQGQAWYSTAIQEQKQDQAVFTGYPCTSGSEV